MDYTTALVDDGPDVKYRGIFINDEEYSNLWARDKFGKFEMDGAEAKQPGVNYYRRVFEVILRMKGNSLWPAMHTRSTPFFGNKNENGDSINGIEAGKYGIVMGSSHCEILLRNSNTEWDGWISDYNKRPGVSNSNTSYNFCTNETAMMQYWRERLQEAKRNGVEAVMTLGLRGKHDGEAAYTNGYYKDRTDMMKAIIKKQRALIAEVYGSANAVAQVYVAYDDLGERYNDGVNALLAQEDYDDIIVMWANDSYGYVRQTPNANEQKREGGSGIYYHTSYMGWGGERKSYLFLNSLPIQQMNEQMHRAYDCGMQSYWILNVGDLKPGDILAQYFIEMGWDINNYLDTGVHDFLVNWCVKQYAMTQADAESVACAIEEFYNLTNMKKAEFYGAENSDPPFSASMIYPLSVTAMGDEGQRTVSRANAMVDSMDTAYEKMDVNTKTAFFEQIYFHAQIYRDIVEEYVYYWKNLEAAKQGRVSSAGVYKAMSQKALQHLLDKVDAYGALNNGKWNKFISPIHYYPSSWGGGQNQGIVMLDESRYRTASAGSGIGAFAEGNASAGSGTLRFNSLSNDTRYIDLFSKSGNMESWTVDKPDWVKITNGAGEEVSSGATVTEQRIFITISDWGNASTDGTITVKNADNSTAASFTVKAVNKAGFDYSGKKGYVEANGYVMIEAEYYSENTVGSDGAKWYKVHDRGPRGDAMKVTDNLPELGSNTNGAAKLSYHVYFENAGTYKLTYYRMATLNEGSYNGVNNGCLTMLAVNGTNVGLMEGTRTFRSGGWFKNIHTSYEPLVQDITVNQGWNTIEVIRSSPSEVVDNILIVTEAGAVLDSLSGPEVSPNNIMSAAEYAAYRQGISDLPAGIADVEPQIQMNEFSGLTLSSGISSEEVAITAKVIYGSGSETISIAVVSDNTGVATVSYANGKIRVIPKSVGVAEITVTASASNASDVTKTFIVKVLDAVEWSKAYKPNDSGNIIINAADAADNPPYAVNVPGTSGSDTYHWIEVTEGSNKSMQLQKSTDTPDTDRTSLQEGVSTGTPWVNADTWISAPQMTYKVYVPTAGNYYLNVYSYAWDGQTDSFHFVLNGQHKFRAGKDEGYFTGEGSWGSLSGDKWWCGTDKAKIYLNAGENTVTIAGRKSGYVLRQIMLSPNQQTIEQNGWLPACTATEGEAKLTLGDFQDVTLTTDDGPEEVTVTWDLSVSSDTVEINVSATDNNVVDVAYENEKITVTPKMAGQTEIIVTAVAGDLTAEKRFSVTVNDASDAVKVYSPNDSGNIIINAADAAQNKPYATNKNSSGNSIVYRWVEVVESDKKSMQVQKDGDQPTSLNEGVTTGTPWNDANTWTDAPQMTFKVSVPADGKYYLNVYSYSWNDQSNSFHFILNGQHQFRAGKDTGKFTNEKDTWGSIAGDEWFYGNVQLDLNAGENTITIAGRKSGYVLRQIMLSPIQQTHLSSWQTACEAAEPAAAADLIEKEPDIWITGLDDVEILVGDTETVWPEMKGDADNPYTVEIASSHKDFVSAEIAEDGAIMLTGVDAGEAKITVSFIFR